MEYHPVNEQEVMGLSRNFGVSNVTGLSVDTYLFEASHKENARHTLILSNIESLDMFFTNNVHSVEDIEIIEDSILIEDDVYHLDSEITDYYGNPCKGCSFSLPVNSGMVTFDGREIIMHVTFTIIKQFDEAYIVECGVAYAEDYLRSEYGVTPYSIYESRYWDDFVFKFIANLPKPYEWFA